MQLTRGEEGETSPRWSPDGNLVAFLAARGTADTTQINVLSNRGGEARQLTDHPTAVSTITWSPDASIIYFLASDEMSSEEQAREAEKNDVYAFEENFVLFPDLFDKPLFAKFNQEQASSDGGAVLLKAAERVYGLVKAFARCLSDKRAPEKIRHTLADLIGQRIFGIACGHPDCNDAEHLADDPIHKLLLGRDPVAGESLASQPTLSRFENAAGRGALYDMGCELAARVGAFPISRSRAHTHRRHGHPLQTVPSAGLIERPQEKNRVDALR